MSKPAGRAAGFPPVGGGGAVADATGTEFSSNPGELPSSWVSVEVRKVR